MRTDPLDQLVRQVAAMDPDEAEAVWPTLTDDQRARVREALASPTASTLPLAMEDWREACLAWVSAARPEQRPPRVGSWTIWFFKAGRGTGKTRSGAEDMSAYARDHPGARLALVGETFGDVRDTMYEGESGMQAVLPPSALQRGSWEDSYNRSLAELTLINGARFKGFSSERPGQLRGPQHHRAWVDEPAKLKDAHRGLPMDTSKDVTFTQLLFGMRLGEHPQIVCTGTPKANALVKAILAHPGTFLTTGTTYDNLANLAPTFRDEILSRYEGTSLARQELLGEMLEEVEGALWKQGWLDAHRIELADLPDLSTKVVGVDPAGGSGPGAAETGIVVVGLGRKDRHGYTTADYSVRGTPEEWGRRAVLAWRDEEADLLVYEHNQGQEMARSVLVGAAQKLEEEGELPNGRPYPVDVWASRGKRTRAEPVAQRYEQGRFHHVGSFPDLESQMTSWVPDEDPVSPDRMDALVWAATRAVLKGHGKGRSTGDQLTRGSMVVAR